MKFQLEAEMPDALLEVFLQHIRDFDQRYANCHFAMLATVDLSTSEVERAIAAVEPSFKFITVQRKS